MVNINVKMADGQTKEIELLRILAINNKEFYLYTYNETTSKGLIKVYASLSEKDGVLTNLVTVSDEDWTLIKGAMNQIITNGSVSSISTVQNNGITVTGNRVIALTNEQKNAIDDKTLTLDTSVSSNNINGISDLGTLDTDAPASLNALNSNNTINNFIDETVNQPINTPVIPNIPNVDNISSNIEDNLDAPTIPKPDNIVSNPFVSSPSSDNFSSPFQPDLNVSSSPTPVITPTESVKEQTAPVEPVNNTDVQSPFINTDVVNNVQEPVVNIQNPETVVDSVKSDEEIDKLIEIAKNNLESSKMIYDSLVNYKNNK